MRFLIPVTDQTEPKTKWDARLRGHDGWGDLYRSGIGIILLFLISSGAAFAAGAELAGATESPQLKACLKRADDLPDMAAFEAEVWMRKGGGNDAHLCRAFAQGNRGMHTDAAREFWALASAYEKQKPKDDNRAMLMHNLAGQEFLKAGDAKSAEAQFKASEAIFPRNASAMLGMAQIHMQADRYWDALAELNAILEKNPDDIAALRQRGLVWRHLNNPNNAKDDFMRAGELAEGKAGK